MDAAVRRQRVLLQLLVQYVMQEFNSCNFSCIKQMESLEQAIDRHRDILTKADQMILKVVLGDPMTMAFLSAGQVARRSGVHEASVVRLAQKLGFEGYPDLRSVIQERVRDAASSSARVSRQLDKTGPKGVLATLIEGEIAALEAIGRHVDEQALVEAARTILDSGRVVLFAYGNASVLAELMDRRLRRAGIATLVMLGEGREIAERLVGLKPDDVVLGFAFRRAPPSIDVVLRHARDVGTKSILITDMIGHLLREQPDMLLAAPRGDDQDFLTLTVPMAICNALVQAIAGHDAGRSLSNLNRLEQLLEQLTNA